MKTFKQLAAGLLMALGLVTGAVAAGGPGIALDKAPKQTNDLASLQNGAKLFVNYCLNCHSAAFMRYNRLQDIGLTEQQIKDNLLFSTDRVGETMKGHRPQAGQGMVWCQPAGPDPDRKGQVQPQRTGCRLSLHLPAHLLPRCHQSHGLEQPGLSQRGHAARDVGTAGRAPPYF